MNKTLPPRALLAMMLASLAVCAQAQGLRLPPGAAGGLSVPAPAAATVPPMAAPPALPSTFSSARTSDGIAAIVGNQVITDYDLQLRVEATRQQAQAAGATLPSAAQLRSQVLNQMIDEVALAQYAEQIGMGVNQDTLDRAIAQVASNNKLTVPELRSAIEKEGMGWSTYRDQLKREILISRLRERSMAQLPTVSESEIDEFLSKQDAAAASPQAAYDIAQIFLPVAQNATEAQVAAVKQKIDAIDAKLKAGADFAQLATQDSQGEGAKRGGDLGMRPANRLPTLFVDTVRNLQPGQISPVIRSAAGFHILKLLQVSGETAAPTTAMQSEVREIVLSAGTDAQRIRAKAELDSIAQAVQNGKVQFSEKARELSQDPATAAKGGALGWVLPGQLDPVLDATLQRLNPGDVSAPIVMGNKVVLLQLVDRAVRPLEASQKRALAREVLQRQKAAEDFDELVRDVRARTYVHIPEND
ncbi:MAG TPA: peptidylprolyl isomerase [Thiomonas arsenitoxydans]|uniref:peptidylprolyl isomerase n=1 Tax=Thiomonas TaxID=32012 RepID=UPI00257FBCBD|nr:MULTISPECIES: peptidylprolyl isomerase [Thiomonas]HML82387.1 peptidylprolyl isomerase [Thiomonas arsenitoxydans]